MSFGGDKEFRAELRAELRHHIPNEVLLLVQAAEYGVLRAERHQGRGAKGNSLQAFVIDLARVWTDETGCAFEATRKDVRRRYNDVPAACRTFVEVALFDEARITKHEVSAERLGWLLTNARKLVSDNQDQMTSASADSGDDRYSEETD